MKPDLNISSDFPKKEELRTFAQQLIEAYNPDLIYISAIREDSAPIYALHLVMKSEDKPKSWEKLAEIAKNFPQYIIQESTAHLLRFLATNGDFYSINQACYGQIIYQSEKVEDSLADMPQKGSSLIRKAQEIADRDFKAFAEEMSGINFHLENKHFERAIIGLDTILMKLLHYVVTLYEGEYKEVEYIEIDIVSRLNAEFEDLFHERNEGIRNILSRLEILHPYGLTSYENVTFYECHPVFEFVKVVSKMVYDITNGFIATWRDIEETRNTQKETTAIDNNSNHLFDTDLKEVVSFLQSQLQVHSLFLLPIRQEKSNKQQDLYRIKKGRQHFECTMLLVTQKHVSMSPAELMDLVYNKVGVKVFFIFNTVTTILEESIDDNNFLKRVINKKNSIYEIDDKLSPYFDEVPHYDYEILSSINKVWKSKINKAKNLQELINDVLQPDNEDPIVALAMAQEALIQACLGMLYAFWEFKPTYISLPYLIHLCSHFNDFPKEILFNDSFSSRRMFYLLAQGQNHLHFGSGYKITEEDKDKAQKLCLQFIEKVEHITEKQLNYVQIKTFHRGRPFYLEKE